MSYPVYKLLRMVNRQYPNNGFINNVNVTESIYDNPDPEKDDGIIPEDLRDLINETIQEVYKDVAIDEVFSFPTVPGQNQYVLPEDCDLRDIQEVTRTFVGCRGPLRPPFGPPPGPGPIPPGPTPPGPDPQYDKIVTFTIDEQYGKLVTTVGTQVGDYTVLYSVQEGSTLPEVPMVIPNEGFDFIGWSLDGETIITDEELLNTPITGDISIIPIVEEEEDEMKSIITAYLSTDFDSTSESEDIIPLDTENKVGNFSLVLNEIVVGSGISKVKVSATIQYVVDTNNTGAMRYFILNKNNAALKTITKSDVSTSGNKYFEVSFTPFTIDVEEGDHIYISTIVPTSTSRKIAGTNNTYLTVEEVKVPTSNSSNENPLNG